MALARAQRGDAGIDRLEAGGHVAEQELAGVGEHDASIDALEQRGRQLSFTAAAGELGTTQPAVSQQIKRLEKELATPLCQ
ncbi:LysR family transcriptional regulator, partial [Escherichia coli]|uniref:helix-turn-helix domain-containing protein n=1 Tax=Escherichia coli TaxID=562 RepID=UPI003749EBB4